MLTISAKVEGEKLTLTKTPVLASGTVGTFEVEFEFDDAWEGFGKIALFWDEDDAVYAAQVTDGKAKVPHEVITEKGKIKFGVYGTNNAKRIVSVKVIYHVEDGAYDSDPEQSVEPTPDLLAQIEAALGQIDDTVEELRALTRGSRSLVALENYSPQGTYVVGSVVMQDSKLYECVVPIREPEDWNPAHWVERNVDYFLMHMAADFPRFGVSGVGGSAPALTRLWDAEELTTPTVSTDLVAGSSPFDNIAPFNRKKCVGSWSVPTGGTKAVFTVNAYYGDPDYAEDGSMGDYVAVEVDPFYYYEANGVLGVSEFEYPGYTIHPVCKDLDGNIREHTYLPCYGLGLKDGHAVSLPGYQTQRGGYKTHRDFAKTYNDDNAKAYAIIEPTAAWHYEWLLQTIEFATQNMQAIMNGAVSMRRNNTDKIVAIPAENKVVVGSGGSNFVIGQTVLIGTYDASVDVSNYNCITNIQKCDADGTLNEDGSYYLVTYDGTDRSSGLTVDTSTMDSRPWINGACAGYAPGVPAILGHTGSPVNLSNGKYPMRYRWRENVYGNINMTCLDLANVRISDGDDQYHLDWYHLPDPRVYSPYGDFTKSDLENPAKGWVKLGTTPKENYVSGYIKELVANPEYPHVKYPFLTTGGSASTYTCDYAHLVFSSEARAVRRGGTVLYGASAGPCYFYAYTAPSLAYWYYGSALYFIQ